MSDEKKTFSLADYQPAAQPKAVVRENLSDLERKDWADQGRKSLFFFAKGILGYKDLSPEIHGPICKLLEDQTNQFVKVVLPRTWFKSTVCSIAFPLWLAVRDSNTRILIAQNTANNARKKLAEISSIIAKNEIFRSVYPECIPGKNEKWTQDEICLPRTLSAPESTIEALGVRSAAISRHYDIIIEDDTVAPDYDEYGEENVAPTKEDIGLAIGWHRLATPFFVDQRTGRNIVVGTRWFEKDLMSYIDEKEPFFKSYERAILETNGKADENGEPAWADRFTRQVIDRILVRMGPYMFSTLYLNKPQASINQIFHLEWFIFFEKEERDLVITTTVDPAGDPEDTKGKPDYCAVVTTGKSLVTGNAFVLEVSRGFWSMSVMIDCLFRHVEKWRPVKVGIEAVAYQKAILPIVRQRQKDQNLWFHLEGIQNNRKSKNLRIQGLQPKVFGKTLFFRRTQMSLVQELISFPNGANDDMADALAMHLPLWQLTRSKAEERAESTEGLLDLNSIIQREQANQKRFKSEANPCFDQLGFLPIPANN